MSGLRSLLLKKLPESKQRSADLRNGHVVALVDTKAGDVIFSEKPYAIGPMLTKTVLSCFGCCRALSRPWSCGGCGVPLCCTACAASPYHRDECRVMQSCGYRFENLSHIDDAHNNQQICILALRLLLLGKESDWETLCESSSKSRKALKKEGGVEAFHKFFEFVYRPMLVFDLERALDAFDVANSNRMGFDRRLKGCQGACVVRICPRVAHSCVANASFHVWMPQLDEYNPSSMDKLRLVYSATVDVAAGDEVTQNKAGPLLCNALRHFQAHLPAGTVCRCRRCKDGTDFGLFLGSPCCLHCKDLGVQSLLVPNLLRGGKVGRQPAQKAPKSNWTEWTCRTCKKRPTCYSDIADLDALRKKMIGIVGKLEDVDDVDGEQDPLELERILEEELYPRGLVHPTFSIILNIKYRMSTDVLLGRNVNVKASRIRRMPDDLLLRIEGHCRDVLRALDQLQVGLDWKRGHALLGFSLLLREKAQRSVAAALPSEHTMETLAESERALRGALQCLRWRRHFWPALLKEVDALEHTKTVMGWLRLLPVLLSVQPSPPQDNA